MADQPAGEKTEDATPRKRQEARKKGTVAKSTDLGGSVSLFVAALILPYTRSTFGSGMLAVLNSAAFEIPQQISFSEILQYTRILLYPAVKAVAPMILTLLVVGVATNFAQVGFVLSGESLKPTMEKINPLAGFKRLLSIRTAFEGVKAVFKLFVFAWIVYATLSSEWNDIIGLAWLSTSQAVAKVGLIIHSILIKIAGFWLALGLIDYFFQRKQVDKQLRMTKDELKREMKQQEGSPEIKAAMFNKRRKLLKGGLAARLALADVIVTNPTHYAVAIQYKRNEMHAPMVLAKGQDYLALKIREIAEHRKIPIVENAPLARALYKKCEPGDFVPRDMFAAVAEVLAYVYKGVKTAKNASVR